MQDLNLQIEDQKLKVLLNTSDSYRIFKSNREEADQKSLVILPKADKNQKYCKFDLFTDAIIGLENLEGCSD